MSKSIKGDSVERCGSVPQAPLPTPSAPAALPWVANDKWLHIHGWTCLCSACMHDK